MHGAGKQIHIGRARALAVAALAGVPMVGLGAGGTILFTGAVTENSCTVRVQNANSSDGTVAPPVVDAAALGRAAQSQITEYFEAGPGQATAGTVNTSVTCSLVYE